MRIIAGQRRGHKIDGPRPKADVRPTSDLVRESLFNIVGGLMPGRVAVDLFAGTGAIGLEALSRDALRVLFIEKSRECVSLIHRNIATLRYEDRAVVRLADAYRWGRSFQATESAPMAVFLDPPYRHYEIRRRQVRELLAALLAKLPAESVVAVEAGRALDETIVPDLGSWDIRRYGDTQLAIRLISGSARGTGADDPIATDPPELAGGEEAPDV
jgi:16S rRNA (guanine966-N2)-methyltransferase